ncbi:peptidase inhibitor family I36 protein [Streptomyces sparsogenes]|uniref:peptidase inhibitor family I36 protein n=1 Tax=Streptomyces sparsogenes TaxID=67365 RepID=UPI0033D22CDD
MISKRMVGAAVGAPLALCGTVAAGPAAAAPAAPAAGWERCQAGYFCVFDGPEGTGGMAWFRSGSADLRAQGMDNRTTSYWNRTTSAWTLYDGYGYTGQELCLGAGAGPWTIAGGRDNTVSSLKATPGRVCPL